MKTTSCAALFILCSSLALLPVGAVFALPGGQADKIRIVRCDVRAYVLDGGSGGINVRSGPGKTYKAIRNLPIQKVEGIEVHITAASGEWVRIDKAVEEGGDPRVLFQGKGWVYARFLGAGGKSITNGVTNLYKETSLRSSIISSVSADDDVSVRGCHGRWMFVEHKKKTGWAAPGTLCANSLTTCV